MMFHQTTRGFSEIKNKLKAYIYVTSLSIRAMRRPPTGMIGNAEIV